MYTFDCSWAPPKISNHHYSDIDCGFCFTHTVIDLATLWLKKVLWVRSRNYNLKKEESPNHVISSIIGSFYIHIIMMNNSNHR